MQGLHSLLHTVGFFFYFPFQVLSVLFTKPTASTRERERKRETGRQGGIVRQAEAERVRARACARLSEHLVSVPARGVGMRESLLGPCSLLMAVRAHTHTCSLSLRTHAQMTRAAAAAAMHKDTGLAPRLTDVALALHAIGCDSCPCPRKPMLCRYLVLLHSPDTCSSSSSCSRTPCECESSLRVLPRIVCKIGY